jgi:hypothetical protein
MLVHGREDKIDQAIISRVEEVAEDLWKWLFYEERRSSPVPRILKIRVSTDVMINLFVE